MIDKLKCLLFGHRRGKRVGITATGTGGKVFAEFKCPRCQSTWIRQERKTS